MCQSRCAPCGNYAPAISECCNGCTYNPSTHQCEATTTTTPTTTPTTVPSQLSLQCDKNTIFVGQKNNCSISSCSNGKWLIANKAGEPLPDSIIKDIPPARVEFGPAEASGTILTKVYCYEPSGDVQHETNVMEGVTLTCPDTCKINEDCRCNVDRCEEGLFSLENSDGRPLSTEISKIIEKSPYSYVFNAIETGEVLATVNCFKPYRIDHITKIKIIKRCSGSVSLALSPDQVIPSGVVKATASGFSECGDKIVYIKKDSCSGTEVNTEACKCLGNETCSCTFGAPSTEGNYTYYACIDVNSDGDFNDAGENAYSKLNVQASKEEFDITDIDCDKINSECKVNIGKNTVQDYVMIFIKLIKEPEGKPFYSGKLNLKAGLKGEKPVSLSEVSECLPNTELRIVAYAYKQSDLENILDRFKADAFTC